MTILADLDTDELHALIDRQQFNGIPHEHSSPDALPYTLVPAGYTVATLPTQDRPLRNKFVVKLADVQSFVRYLQDHTGDASRIYATLVPARFLAVLDETSSADDALPMWRGWRAEFAPKASPEWSTWTGSNRTKFTQTAFAEFLQDNVPDIIEPPGADLLQMALSFEASIDGTFISAQRMQDGAVNFAYRLDTQVQRAIKMPEEIILAIPVFENDTQREVRARLRYRIAEGRLTLHYELIRPHKVLDAAFRDTWERIDRETGVPVLLGVPE